MWTETTRGHYEHQSVRYSTDLTNREFSLIEGLLPARRYLGRPRSTDFREVMNAILYLLRTGCQWAMLPKDFPPSGTVYGYFRSWKRDGVWARVHHKLLMAVREQCGREASPTAGIIDSQSVKAKESGGLPASTSVSGSRAASAISSSIRRGSCCRRSFTRPRSRIETAP